MTGMTKHELDFHFTRYYLGSLVSCGEDESLKIKRSFKAANILFNLVNDLNKNLQLRFCYCIAQELSSQPHEEQYLCEFINKKCQELRREYDIK